jgi:glyoxylase-like metal-dependent hydrolase (beta-lactamase superfamily II)
MIDTHMFGFAYFQSVFLIAGKEVALIDTGVPTSWEAVKNGIQEHGFSISDISYIFITHSEHPDHAGNAGMILRENPKARVYINPIGAEYLLKPEVEAAKRKINLTSQMAARFGEMIPIPESRIQYLKDGDIFDLGNGEKLRVIFTPGHQPSGIVIFAEKNQGLFINDLPGSYFADAGASFIFTPYRMDVKTSLESLKKVSSLPVNTLYLGHFGINDEPWKVIQNASRKMQQLLDLGIRCIRQGKPEEIESQAIALLMPEADKLRITRGESLYEYVIRELIPSMSQAYARYSQENIKG